MLVLSRKSGETIRIGDDIVVTITELRGGRVKIGIQAPGDCSIRRGELPSWTESEAEVAAPQPKAAHVSQRPKMPRAPESNAPLRRARLSLPGMTSTSSLISH